MNKNLNENKNSEEKKPDKKPDDLKRLNIKKDIFNNKYNVGDFDIDSNIFEKDVFGLDGHEQDFELDGLLENISKYFEKSEYYVKYKNNNNILKEDEFEVFYDVFSKLKDLPFKYSYVDMFVYTCEFFNLNLKVIFDKIYPIDKERILDELKKFKSNKKIKRLF